MYTQGANMQNDSCPCLCLQFAIMLLCNIYCGTLIFIYFVNLTIYTRFCVEGLYLAIVCDVLYCVSFVLCATSRSSTPNPVAFWTVQWQ